MTWAGRLLYLELFISLMVAMGYWHLPFTFAFIGAVGSLIWVGIQWKNKEVEEITETKIVPQYPSTLYADMNT